VDAADDWTGVTAFTLEDLKIASIALVNDALLLTANSRDFEKVPGLQFENWLT
jgi:predicted nucleic acid-binding protein